MSFTFKSIFRSKQRAFMEVLKYGASKLQEHVSGEGAIEFMKEVIELEMKNEPD
jgi:hypothetical protein